jgi:uracil-DNA glycosylase
MISIFLPQVGTFAAWRSAARYFVAAGINPQDVAWNFDRQTDDLLAIDQLSMNGCGPVKASHAFLGLAEAIICHRDPERFRLLHDVLFELQKDIRLLRDVADPRVARLMRMEKSVRRDCHKMRAFVRFKDAGLSKIGRRRFFAWFEPEHFIVERNAPFFAGRFGDMDWTITTPSLTAQFENGQLSFLTGTSKPKIPQDGMDDLWRVYYGSIFNPARLEVKAMTREMPKKYWNNLPEADLIPELIASAEARASEMMMAEPTQETSRVRKIKENSSRSPVSPREDEMPLSVLDAKRDAAGCTRCDLYRHATQTVFGEGPENADVMFVGEQPGDREDLQGRPFVGPAGQLFDQALREAEIDRSRAYITNAVKHFKFEPRGKFRLHKKPDTSEITACKWWLNMETALLKPKLIVAMGATATQALTGNGQGILKRRGTIEATADGTPVLITIHPSALLRIPDPDIAAQARKQFKDDLKLILSYI